MDGFSKFFFIVAITKVGLLAIPRRTFSRCSVQRRTFRVIGLILYFLCVLYISCVYRDNSLFRTGGINEVNVYQDDVKLSSTVSLM